MMHFPVKSANGFGTRDLVDQVQQLQDKVHQLARMVDRSGEAVTSSALPDPATAERVRDILRARRARSRYFDSQLFADPAWDILLDLYACHLAQQRMSVSSLCIGAAVPSTTALRWIKLLESKELILRSDDPLDGRRVFLRLSPGAISTMDSLLQAIPAGERLV